jgi:coenzyme F420-0:L-glutamate ligase/coenzyme F420-1:gamma-L-glutamate ligase
MRQYPEVFAALVAGRHSIRSFSSEPVSNDTIERLILSACHAPSAHNRQPWRFVVLSDRVEKSKLAKVMGEKLRVDRRADGHDSSCIEAEIIQSTDQIMGAPVVIVLCLTMEDMDQYPDERRAKAEHLMAVQSVAMAGQNLLLAAHAEGLGACWMCAPLFAQDIVRETMGLPDSWEPQGMILLGHPADDGRERSRKPVSEVMLWR